MAESAGVLTEDDVVTAVCGYLQRNGYDVLSRCSTGQRGIDIVARDETGRMLRVEAKGGTSARTTSARYGKPFDRAQSRDHVAMAFYAAAAMLSEHAGDRVAVALPDTPLHQDYVGRIGVAMGKLDVAVFWVGADKSVRAEYSSG